MKELFPQTDSHPKAKKGRDEVQMRLAAGGHKLASAASLSAAAAEVSTSLEGDLHPEHCVFGEK